MRMKVQSLAFLCGLRIQCCRELWCRLLWGSDPALLWLWLWLWPAAADSIQPLAWELPHATGVALKTNKQTNKNVMKVRSLDFSMGGGVSVSLLIF